jgi:GNAT superfamily N-acetyltransferase
VIRPIAAGDREAWAELFVAYGVFYETDFTAEVVESTWSRLLDPTEGVDALVAEVDGAVVGFAHYRSHPDTFSTGRDWFLDDLFTAPSSRGTGVATELIEHLKSMTNGGTLRWITAESNTTAQRVYDKLATKTTWVTYEAKG